MPKKNSMRAARYLDGDTTWENPFGHKIVERIKENKSLLTSFRSSHLVVTLRILIDIRLVWFSQACGITRLPMGFVPG